MPAGFLFQGDCFSTNSEAADAFFLSEGPAFASGSTSYLSWFEKVGSVWQIKREAIASNGVVTSLVSTDASIPTFPTCDTTATFFDGMEIGWGVAFAMIAAWLVKNLRRGL